MDIVPCNDSTNYVVTRENMTVWVEKIGQYGAIVTHFESTLPKNICIHLIILLTN